MRIAIGMVLAVLSVSGSAPLQRAEPEREGPTLTVTGEGEASARPDRAVVHLGATAQAPDAASAQREVSQTVRRALAALAEAGLADDALQTSGLSIVPVHTEVRPTPDGPSEPRIAAYRASNTLRVELDDPDAVGGVVDAAIGAGANELRGLSFELRDDTQERLNAMRSAVSDARAKAEVLAQAAGVSLVELRRIDAGGVDSQAPFEHARMMSFDAGTPVRPGEVSVRATVTLTYRIAPLDEDR